MKTITYHPKGEAFPDAYAEKSARDFLALEGVASIEVSTENFILAVRVLIKEGVIPHDQVDFRFRHHVICPDKDGRLDSWPDGFCSVFDNLLSRIL